ncbi:MAG: phosphatidate cytidylyltransferase [Chloroflexota bacterium]
MRFGRHAPSNFAVRVATASVGIPVLLGINRLGGWAFALLIGSAAVIAQMECVSLFRMGGHRPARILGGLTALALAVLPAFYAHPQAAWTGVMVLLFALSGAVYMSPRGYSAGLASWGLTIMAAVYVGLFFGHLALLRHAREGAWWIFLVLIMTWAYDTGAYAAGRLFGRHGFMRHVSPSKTVEGVVGGLVFSSLAALIAVPSLGIEPWKAILLGLATGVVAQLGDLCESVIKRQCGAKDSGTIIPGHGGLLDRVDSLLFTGTFCFYAAALFGYGT